MKKLLVVLILIFIGIFFLIFKSSTTNISKSVKQAGKNIMQSVNDPLAIQVMRDKSYPGSDITIEQALSDGSNYHQYLTSYKSDGLKIYALLTVPFGAKPKNGWPVILFNHGYITPSQYQTFPSVGQYATYSPEFSRNGYIVFKPDFRGNGKSEGKPEGAYFSPAYATDDLNALASIKKYKDANPDKVGIWGHSMGGNITLRDLVVRPNDVRVAVIWGGVVGSYEDLSTWHDPSYHPSAYELQLRYLHRSDLQKQHGTPQDNPTFWHAVDPTYFLSDITIPIQLHAGENDEEVPVGFSESLYTKLKALGKIVEFYMYPGANHNITQGFDLAMQRSLAFFDKYLK